MADDNTRGADPASLDTVRHEMDNVWAQFAVNVFINICVVVSNRTSHPIEGALPANPYDVFAIHGSNKQFSDNWPHSIEILFIYHVALYYTKGSVVCCQMSVILLGEGGKERLSSTI